MRLLVCGNRDWTCVETIVAWLRPLILLAERRGDGFVLIHGGATGVDCAAGELATGYGCTVEEYPADWQRWGDSAGPRRNAEMATKAIDRGLAFGVLARGGRKTGTGDMVGRLVAAGVPVTIVPRLGLRP